ncbi:GGDEF domain-containing protein [Aliihoeflea sp. PC F10.4]
MAGFSAMAIDYVSLLLATAISGACLSITMFAFWMTARRDEFKLTWSLAILILVIHVIAYSYYAAAPALLLGTIVIGFLPLGTAILYGAAQQFFGQTVDKKELAIISVLAVGIPLSALFAGYDGVAFILQNTAAATLLAMSGRIYFIRRAEAPIPLLLMTALYAMASASFALCGLVLLANGQWVIGGVPDNWAERVNIIVAIVGMTGAGALSVALDQTRLAQHHRSESVTDPLTGLLNRRGMMLTVPDKALGSYAAIAIFDLDHFKQINDRHGHASGDDVLVRFANLLEDGKRNRDIAVRIGGEEFALFMPRTDSDHAAAVVRHICESLSEEEFSGDGAFRCTVSAGIGFGDDHNPSVSDVLARADSALYAAKKAGRNRVEIEGNLRLAI